MTLHEEFYAPTEAYLREKGWLLPKMQVYDYKMAGESNMNFVARVSTNHGNIILKQSSDFVRKYPQIAAPIERIEVEHTYYQKIKDHPVLSTYSPKIIGFDAEYHILAMEDLGYNADYLGLYAGSDSITESTIRQLVSYLLSLHGLDALPFPNNGAMKKLNHEHIFHFPFLEDNGFDLDAIQPGLQAIARPFKQDRLLKNAITELGLRYLSDGPTLLHGDFYPGSWLNATDGVKVIDPEFAYLGDAAFDLGVMCAHFNLAGMSRQLIELTLNNYTSLRPIDQKLLDQYTGVEILRRLIGVAQLPLDMKLDQKLVLLDKARALVID